MRSTALFAIALAAWLAPLPAFAQEAPPALSKTGASLGLDVHRYQDDFGLNARVSSPAFLELLRLTAAGGISWYPYALAADGTSTWKEFYQGSLSVEVGPSFVAGAGTIVRPYGFGGAMVLFVPDSLATRAVGFGGIGGFGLEVEFVHPQGGEGPVTYFFEMGGIGAGASADKLPSHASLASGFLLAAGLRFYP